MKQLFQSSVSPNLPLCTSFYLGMAISQVFRVTRPAPPRLEWVWEYRNRGWDEFKFLKKTRIGFGVGSSLVTICPAPPHPEYETTSLPSPINICFLSFLVFLSRFRFFFSRFRVLVLGVVDENTSDDGNGAVPNHLRRPHHTRLPRPLSAPVSNVKKWLPQIPPILVLVPETHP